MRNRVQHRNEVAPHQIHGPALVRPITLDVQGRKTRGPCESDYSGKKSQVGREFPPHP